MLLPSHEHGVGIATHRQVWGFQLVLHMTKGREAGPMHHVTFLIGTPSSRQKAICTADDFGIEVSGELQPVICKPSEFWKRWEVFYICQRAR